MNNKPTKVKPAKICYEHIGGKLGQLLAITFAEKGWIAKENPADKHFYITEIGIIEFGKLGIDLSEIKLEDF
ncbi:ArsR family transcriptional regulator [Flavobacterium daemonense]|uniref:ArsR family transcriptional regulator n=1 Tax=Flavobacterium daemonense TaxID=1393049 RepID=UPI001186A76D|nr:ArsR family transcriptional regulator [Flavobacterium daemonense]KAF2333810.1 ArsR family transcriptional regulator [Flavobacterium daemonense]